MGAIVSVFSGKPETVVTSSVVNDILVSTILENTTSCRTINVNNQDFQISGDWNFVENVTQSITTNVNSQCIDTIKQDDTKVSKVNTDLEQKLSSVMDGLVGMFNNAKTQTNNDIRNVIKTENVTKNALSMLAKTLNNNRILVSGDHNTIRNVIQNMSTNSLTSAVMQDEQISKSVNDISNSVVQRESAELKFGLLDTIGNFISSISSVLRSGITSFSVIVIALVGGICLLVFILVKAGLFDTIATILS